jgi:uncharacterized SAM-binding protein YcdF (DUF218 family)
LDILAEWFKQWFIPGSFSFFLLGALLGLVLLYLNDRRSRWGRRWLTVLIGFYALMAIPAIASGLENILQGELGEGYPTQRIEDIDAIVVLGGGGASYTAGDRELSVLSEASALRLIEGLRLWEQLKPEWIVVSGGDNPRAGLLTAESETMRDTLIELGVPREHILLEAGSANTHDQSQNLQPIFKTNGINRFVLVTSPTHMRRAYLTFVHAGFDPIPAAALEHSQSKTSFGNAVLPSLDALNASRNVMRELFGLLYYALRGWV